MIYQMFNAMVTVLLTKFMLNDVPHAAGMLEPDYEAKYFLSQKGAKAIAAAWFVNAVFYRSINEISDIPVEIPIHKVHDFLIEGGPGFYTEQDLRNLTVIGITGHEVLQLVREAKDPSTTDIAIQDLSNRLSDLVHLDILRTARHDIFLIDKRYLVIYEILEHFMTQADELPNAETLKDAFESVELGYWGMEEYIGPLNVTFEEFCSYMRLLIKEGYVIRA